ARQVATNWLQSLLNAGREKISGGMWYPSGKSPPGIQATQGKEAEELELTTLRLSMQPAIPFNKPFIVGKELFYIAQAVNFGNLAGDGFYTRSCSRILEN